MHLNYFALRKLRLYAVCQFLIFSAILNVAARPGYYSNHQNSFNSVSGKKENVTFSLEDIFPNYIVTSDYCDDGPCKKTYEVANYPYEQITEVFPEVSKRLWDHTETSIYTISNRGQEEDEQVISEVYGDNNVTFRMQTAATESPPGIGKNIIEVSRRVPALFGSEKTNRCAEIRETIMPLTGKSNGREYYITNIKTYSQTITVIKCVRIGVTCSNKSVDPEGITFTCKQEYIDMELSSFPVGENISLESHCRIPFKVPQGCACSMSWA